MGSLEAWASWLAGQQPSHGSLREGTVAFQRLNGLEPSGQLDAPTLARARALGWEGSLVLERGRVQPEGYLSALYPPEAHPPLRSSHAFRVAELGGEPPFERIGESGRVILSQAWIREHVAFAELPALQHLGAERVRFHRRGVAQLEALVNAWEKAHLLPFLTSWDGTFAPRFQRGSRTQLSGHAWACALDINAAHNPLGRTPALVGEVGSVRPLVQLAEAHGFAWGGRWASRPDGMHLELARLLA